MPRYEKLYELGKQQYFAGSPLILEAGQLLRDNQTMSMLVQIKFSSVAEQAIRAIIIRVDGYDILNQQVESKEFQYLDLNVNRYAACCDRTPIQLQNSTIRRIDVLVEKVVFADSTLWENEAQEPFAPLPGPIDIALPGDVQVQYNRELGKSPAYQVQTSRGLWQCGCGAWNRTQDEACHACRLNREKQQSLCSEEVLRPLLEAYEESVRQDLYNRALRTMQTAGDDPFKWKETVRALSKSELNGYLDVEELKNQAKAGFAAAQKKKEDACRAEQERLAQKKKERQRKLKRRAILITSLIAVVIAVLVVFFVIIPNNNYNNAKSLMNAEKYEEAIAAFEALNGYKDSADQIVACQELKEKEKKYQEATTLNKAGKYAEAYAVFATITGYKDVDKIIKEDDNISAAAAKIVPFKNVGGYVTFGHYPQTKAGTDSTAIEWIVLAYDSTNNRSLIISRYGLDAKPYNTTYTSVTWETCTLRTWLNNDFYNKAFSKTEQSAILTTTVDNSKSQCYSGYSTSGGKNTQDKIFLLSYAEANKYFGVQHYSVSGAENNVKSRVQPTAYAISQGAYTNSDYKTSDGAAAGYWWLRSPGNDLNFAAYVRTDGSLNRIGVGLGDIAVRPALWVNLESGIF